MNPASRAGGGHPGGGFHQIELRTLTFLEELLRLWRTSEEKTCAEKQDRSFFY